MAKLSAFQRGNRDLLVKTTKTKKNKRSLSKTPRMSKRVSKQELLNY